MAKGFKHGAGGGAPLNFKIVGNPKPSNPSKNTIWVDTDTKITGWHFGAEDISGQLDVTNAVNASYVVSGLSNGEIHFKGDIPAVWTNTYIAKCRLIAGVTYILAANLGYGRFNIVKDPKVTGDAVYDFVEHLLCGYILDSSKNQVEITPLVTSDYYLRFCTDRANANGTKPAFSTGILLHPKGTPVWIQTGTSSPAEFNALKKNGITVYPIAAKQYLGGALVDKTASIYKNDTWIDLMSFLIRNGSDITSITGGWDVCYWGHTSTHQRTTPVITWSGDALIMDINQSSMSEWYGDYCYHWGYGAKNAVDLTDVKSIELICDSYAYGGSYPEDDGGHAWTKLVVGKSKDSSPVAAATIASRATVKNKTITLDVSNLTGVYYIGFFASFYCANSKALRVDAYNIELKR